MGRRKSFLPSVGSLTKRPQNVCKSCNYTWHPRGHSLSSKCPKCGSNLTSVGCMGIALSMFLVLIVFVGSVILTIGQ
ncbi:MAG: hypothetical protein WAQ98_14705 [Blastocatellia bacterium]